MPTLSFHAPPNASRKIRAAARKRGVPISRFLRDAAEAAVAGAPTSGLGRELERMAIDGLALVSLAGMRARAKETGADRMTRAQITTIIKASRHERHARA